MKIIFVGIPISQQHLIHDNVEMRDEYTLRDYNIQNGSTLRLVLGMRGGPINTRRGFDRFRYFNDTYFKNENIQLHISMKIFTSLTKI